MGLSLVVVLLVLGGAAWYAGTRDRPKGLYPQPGDPPPVESPREIGAISTDDPEAIASAPPRESVSADVLGNVPSTADGTLAMETPASAEPRGPDLGSPWTVPTIQLEMIWNAAGTFTMGSPRAESGRMASEGPQTRVTLSQGFWLGKYEVTQGQWDALMAGNPSEFENAGANAPVENLSWNEAMAFCRKLTAIERDAGRIPEGYAYSLPTEAQWEYACRAGTSEPLSSGPLTFRGGNDAPELDAVAWYGGNSGVAYEGGRDSSGWKNKQYPHTKAGTHPVGQKQANPWGFHDMHGNVWEWCADRLSNTLPGGDVIDPAGSPSSSVRVIRGGGWDSIVWSCRSASRRGIKPDNRAPNVGFRLALTPAHEANPTRSAQGYD